MSDLESNLNQTSASSTHPPSSLFGKYYDDMNPSAVVAAFAILEATVFFGLGLLDPELGSMLIWGSIAVATLSAGTYYTILCLQARERSYPLSFSYIIGLLLVVCIVCGIHGVYSLWNTWFPIIQAIEIFLFLLPVVSIPVLIIHAVQYFKANLAILQHHPQGVSLNKDTLPSLVLIRRLDSLLSRILMGLGVIFSLLFVGTVVLMARTQYVSWTEIFLSVCLMAWLFGAFAYLLVMFFISHRPRPGQKKNKVVVETAGTDEPTTTHHQVLLDPLLGTQNSESVALLVV